MGMAGLIAYASSTRYEMLHMTLRALLTAHCTM